ncbi:RNA-directed DNA polymerase, eukaryota, reverse transcriptase zinc-binding domain protein [Tanacetum coccineum]
MRRSLKTQDKLRTWDVGPTVDLMSLRCSLCDVHMDSHEHLFFECTFSLKVWLYVRTLAEMDNVSLMLHDILSFLQPSRKAQCIFGKLFLAAIAYYIRNKRNNRLFCNVKRTPEDIREMIMVTVRLKLLTFKFKNKPSVNRLLERWKMPTSFRIYGS